MDARSASAQMIGTVLSGRYRLEAKLGSGGMSTVYLARDETLDRQVAVKVMHREMSEQADQLERFRQEARAVAKLSHPNVVAVIDAGEDRGHPYIVFEYVEGETLKQRISRVGALDTQEALAYTIEIARGLTVAHSVPMVHRDVKPQNVLIDTEGRAKLTDFGISRQLEQHGLTATGRVLGTTDYVAPEQAMGQGVDPRSDIYSLGVLLYEMLTGDVPFHAESQVGVAMKHVNEDLPDVQGRRGDVSAAAALVVERATNKDPARRYQQVGEMIDDLQTALEVEAARAGSTTGEATSVLDAVPAPKRKLSVRRRPNFLVVLLGMLLIGIVLSLVYGISHGWFGGGGAGADKQGDHGGGTAQTFSIQAAHDFDPEGDGEEHSAQVGLAVDNNPSPTGGAWSTETYDSGFSGAGKAGVGIYVDAGQPVPATRMTVLAGKGGWKAEVYGANALPPTVDQSNIHDPNAALAGWTLISEETDMSTRTDIDINARSTPYRYYLLWITDLPPDGVVEIDDIKLSS